MSLRTLIFSKGGVQAFPHLTLCWAGLAGHCTKVTRMQWVSIQILAQKF